MNWFTKTNRIWTHQFNKDLDITSFIGKIDSDKEIYLVLAHYNKKGIIYKYSAWHQSESHVKTGGSNFALKIKECSTYQECIRQCENFYRDLLDNNSPKHISTQYFDDDIVDTGPFLN